MKKFRCIAVASSSFSKNQKLVSEASELAEKIIINPFSKNWTDASIVEWLNDCKADAVIIGTDPFHKDVIEQLLHVRAVGKYGVGCDNVDIDELRSRSIHFGWEAGVNKRSVSELTLGFMLGHCRNIFRTTDKMQNGVWEKNGGFQLSDRTIGIVGLGHVGCDLAKILKVFGAKVFYHDILDKSLEANKLGITKLSYDEMIRIADIITFHVPGGTATTGMFSAEQIKSARPNLLVVNTARGKVIDFPAIAAAVKAKKIAGYASDVFPEEPFHSEEFRIQDGFYFTPHIGANTEESILAMGRSAIKGLRDYLSR